MPHIAPWFPDAKLGVFIHWVLTSAEPGVPWNTSGAGPDWREQARARARKFTAARFDARDWARRFKDWGARYAVLTTKHHIGFALFDYEGSPLTAANSSPAGRDLVAEYVDALHAEGLKVGLYYSQPDWCHPDYASLTGGDNPKAYAKTEDPERWARFVDHMFAEIRHLLTSYGRIDLMWFDGDWERTVDQWRNVELVEMMEQLAPGIVLNNRLRHACLGHYGTPEQCVPLRPPAGWWEMCDTLGEKWHYDAEDMQHLKPVTELVRRFTDITGMGGNLLLNISPLPDGSIPPEEIERMEGLGGWIRDHAEAIYATEAGLPPEHFAGASTRSGSVLYLVACDQPRPELVVKGIKSSVARATHLASGRELKWRISGGRTKFDRPGWLFIEVPADLMDEHATVVRLEFEDDVLEIEMPDRTTRTYRGRPRLEERAAYEGRE